MMFNLELSNSFYGMLYHQSSQHKAEDGGDVRQGAIDLRFRRAPLVIQQVGIARTVLGFGTHALLGAASGIVTFVL